MKIKTFAHFFNEGFKSVVRNRLMSSASIITVTATLFVFGVFMALVLNVNNIAVSQSGKIEIEGFLRIDNTLSQRNEIEGSIKRIKGVKSLEYISKEQALQNLKIMLGGNKDLASGLDTENPLPASYIIKVDNPLDVKEVSKQLKIMNVFEKINDGQEIVNKIIKITNFIKLASLVLMILLGVVAVSLISNTIKLTVYARKREIGIMKYIGATDWFIRWPFIIEGVALGLLGALISIIMLWVFYAYVSNLISKDLMLFPLVTTSQLLNTVGYGFCILGFLIGGIGSTLSIRKFLVK
jgi:cell division transport system permease protein